MIENSCKQIKNSYKLIEYSLRQIKINRKLPYNPKKINSPPKDQSTSLSNNAQLNLTEQYSQ